MVEQMDAIKRFLEKSLFITAKYNVNTYIPRSRNTPVRATILFNFMRTPFFRAKLFDRLHYNEKVGFSQPKRLFGEPEWMEEDFGFIKKF